MVPVESSSPCLVRFLSEADIFPSPKLPLSTAGFMIPGAWMLGVAGFSIAGWPFPAICAGIAGGLAFTLLLARSERNLPAAERRHREAHKVRERLKTMMTTRTLHRVLDQGLIDLLDEGARQYLLARGHASKINHALTAQADATAVAIMDDLLLEIGMILPEKAPPRSMGDALADSFIAQPGSPLGAGLGRLFGATPPPETDFETMRRIRPHIQALADLANELERTLPSLVQSLDIPSTTPPIHQTLTALREHRESREQLERELRLGG